MGDSAGKRYLPSSWLDPRLEVRPRSTAGRGLFARSPIRAGEVVVIWGGTVYTRREIEEGRAAPGSWVAISEDRYLGSPPGSPEDPADLMNHSCDPNVWMEDEVTLVARRDVRAGEELTADYAMFEADEGYVMPWACGCGSRLCRHTITGRDWRLPELQERYGGHFSPFLNARIERLRAESR